MSEKAIDYFISYPKSGRTWVRFMYLTYLELHFGLTHKNIFDTEADLIYYWQPKGIHLGTAPEENNIFYSVGSVNFEHLRKSSCVWMTRNIYDTLVSLYHHSCHRDNVNYTDSISNFVRDPKFGALKICCFYAAMYDNLYNGIKKVMRISYEEMEKDSLSVLSKLLDYVGLKQNNDFAKIAIEKSRFENMKKLGNSYAYKDTWLAPSDMNNQNSYKIRKAKTGSFKDDLSEEDIKYIDNIVSIMLPNNKEILRWN
jgi:hypothetical protein